MVKKTNKIIAGALTALMIASTAAVTPVSAMNYSNSALISESSVKLSTTKTDLTKGYSFTLKVSGASGAVKFYSEDSSIATVTNGGKVVGKQVGKTTVYASVDGELYPCEVNVVATKVSPKKSSMSISVGDSAAVKITIKGSKHVKADSLDKNVATVSWDSSWDGNAATLYVKGVSAGTTRIKLYNPSYPNYYKLITVNVGGNQTGTTTSSIVSTKKTLEMLGGKTETFRVTSTKPLSVATSNTNVVIPTIAYKNGFYEVSATSVDEGTAAITIYETNNPSNYVNVAVSVKGNSSVTVNPATRYYVEKTYNLVNPTANKIEIRTATDKIAYYADEDTCQLKYMIVPYNYVPDENVYVVAADEIIPNGILTSRPNYYPYYKALGTYKGYFGIRYYDLAHPTNNDFTMARDDKFAWTITPNGTILYTIVPSAANLDLDQFEYVLNADGTPYLVNVDYYRVIRNIPRKRTSSDSVLTWTDYSGSVYYMLVPYHYDEVKANTAAAKYMGFYEYYTVYSSRPTKTTSSDIVISYINENTNSDRYILVPRNYSESRVDRLKEKDLGRPAYDTSTSNIDEILTSINSERRKSGISALSNSDTALDAAAKKRVSELEDRYSHKRPDGSSYKTALDEAGVIYKHSNEIIFKNKEYSYEVIDALFEDEDYRDILLSSLNNKIAISYNSVNDYYVILITD